MTAPANVDALPVWMQLQLELTANEVKIIASPEYARALPDRVSLVDESGDRLFDIEMSDGANARLAVVVLQDVVGLRVLAVPPGWRLDAAVRDGNPVLVVIAPASRLLLFVNRQRVARGEVLGVILHPDHVDVAPTPTPTSPPPPPPPDDFDESTWS